MPMLKIQMMLMLNTWMMLINIIIMQLLMGKWMTCDKLSSGNGGCLIVNQAHTISITNTLQDMMVQFLTFEIPYCEPGS